MEYIKRLKQFPFVSQYDIMDCGPACLSMITHYYKNPATINYLKRKCSVSNQGVSLFILEKVAKEIGFDTKCVSANIKDLIENTLFPCIIHYKLNHYCVIWDIQDNIVLMGNPTYSANSVIPLDDFLNDWIVSDDSSGIVMLLSPTEIFRTFYFPENKKHLRVFYKLLSPNKRLLAIVFLILLFSGLSQILLPFISQKVIDKGINGHDVNLVYMLLFAQLALIIGKYLMEYFHKIIILRVSLAINVNLMGQFIKDVLVAPLQLIEGKLKGDLLQRLNDFKRIEQFLSATFISVFLSVITLVACTSVVFWHSMTLGSIFVFGAFVYLWWIRKNALKRKKIDIEYFQKNSKLEDLFLQLISGITDLRVYNGQKKISSSLETAQKNQYSTIVKGTKLGQKIQIGGVFISEIKNLLITLIIITWVIKNKMTFGELVALQYIVGQAEYPIGQILKFYLDYQDASFSFDRLQEFQELKKDDNCSVAEKKYFIDVSTDIIFDSVFLKYNQNNQSYVLKNISLTIPAKKTTVVVGESGCGKTTLLKLLMGIYTPDLGTISINGVNIGEIKFNDWASQYSAVLHDNIMFNDTLENNINLSNSPTDLDKMKTCIEKSGLNMFIPNWPQSIKVTLGNQGQNLSQGQKQRLFIARALYKNSNILFLDEPTSSLDKISESNIIINLREWFAGKTVVMTTHRISTIYKADYIVMIDNGSVVEAGTLKQLLNNNGKFAHLIGKQLLAV